jgi:hypothetical protein
MDLIQGWSRTIFKMACSIRDRKIIHAGGNAKTKSEIARAGFSGLDFYGIM